MIRSVTTILLLLLFVACNNENNGYEKGVSRELAVKRKSVIGGVAYNLYFTIPEDKSEVVTGESHITFDLLTLSDVILDFKADKEQILSITSDGRRLAYSFHNEHIIIPENALIKGRNTIEIKFIAGDLSLNRGKEILYTLLMPERCRTLMPCFDQPDIKARFKLMLKIPPDWKATGNGELIRMEQFSNHKIYEFEETKPISTYLFAFVAGKFEYVEHYVGGRWIAIYHRETDSVKITANLSAIVDDVDYSLNWMERYTGIRYPFKVYNVIAIPDLQQMGIEHPGATYFSSSILFPKSATNEIDKMHRSELIAHKTANMWFGNLVTIKWFDDLWLKEVFAGLMADKILARRYPGENHQLRFYLKHHESALATDRTRGSHPIIQHPDNLEDAGILYDDITYHKAPIVMRMLEQQISPERLRFVLANYLRKWQYSNAGWSDLLEILEPVVGTGLNEWSDVWLRGAGAPVVDFSDREVRVLDEWGEGRIWPQTITLYFARHRHSLFQITDTLIPYPLENMVLPNCNGRGYGSFLPTENTIRFLFDNLGRIDEAIHRAVAWQVLYEGVLFKRVKGESFIRMCIKHLPTETNDLIINRSLLFLVKVFKTYLDEGARQLLRDDLESFFTMMLFKNTPYISKSPFFKAFLTIYSSPDAGNYFYKVLTGNIVRHDLVLTDEDRLQIAYNIVLRSPNRYSRMQNYIRRNIKDRNLLDRFEYLLPALSGDKEVRDSVFQALMRYENRRNEVWAAEALSWLNHPKRKMESEKYIPQILGKLQEIHKTGSVFFPIEWLNAGLAYHTSKQAYSTVKQFLDKNQALPESLRLKILASTDHLRRLYSE